MILLTVNQVAEMLNCKTSTVYAFVKAGKLPGYKINGLLRLAENEILEYISKCKITIKPNPKSIPIKSLKKGDIDFIVKNSIESTLKSGL